MKIYTIETHYYDNNKVETFENREEWEGEMNNEASRGANMGNGGEFVVAIYEVEAEPVKNLSRNQGKAKNSFQNYRSYNERLVDEYGDHLEPLESQIVSYYSITENADGKFYNEGGDEYDTEEEAIEFNKPSEYLTI